MAKHEPASKVVICDAGPLIHLDELECLDLLSDFLDVIVPNAVWKEVEQHRSRALQQQYVSLRQVALIAPPSSQMVAIAKLFTLHADEWEALRLAVQERAELLLTDDTAARLAAQSLNIDVHGTIGVLLRSLRRGQRNRDQVTAVLQSIPLVSTLHIKRSLLAEIIEAVEKSR